MEQEEGWCCDHWPRVPGGTGGPTLLPVFWPGCHLGAELVQAGMDVSLDSFHDPFKLFQVEGRRVWNMGFGMAQT